MNNFTKNPTVLSWIEDMKALLTPDNVVVIDGSEEQLEALRAEAVASGELIKLNERLAKEVDDIKNIILKE